MYDNGPGLFHYLPQQIRFDRTKKALGPAGAWWLKDRVLGRLPILLGYHVSGAEVRAGQVLLQLVDQGGRKQELLTEHVIAGTGDRPNIHGLPFLTQDLKLQLRLEEKLPC